MIELARGPWDAGPRRAVIAAENVTTLRSALTAVLDRDPSWALKNNAASFTTREGLTYAESEADLKSLSVENTFVLQKLEGQHSLFAEISRRCESDSHSHVSISAYASHVGATSIGQHQDLWDNIVVQLAGRKTFMLGDTAITLGVGDVIQIPYGDLHDVATVEQSLHLSVVLLRRGWQSPNAK